MHQHTKPSKFTPNISRIIMHKPSGIRPLKIHSDFEKAPEKAPWITFKITSNVQFWGAFRRLKDRITVKLPSEGPSKCEKESNLGVIPGAFSVYSKRNLKVIWGALFNVNYFDKEKRMIPSHSCVWGWRASMWREMRIDTEKGTARIRTHEQGQEDQALYRLHYEDIAIKSPSFSAYKAMMCGKVI